MANRPKKKRLPVYDYIVNYNNVWPVRVDYIGLV